MWQMLWRKLMQTPVHPVLKQEILAAHGPAVGGCYIRFIELITQAIQAELARLTPPPGTTSDKLASPPCRSSPAP